MPTDIRYQFVGCSRRLNNKEIVSFLNKGMILNVTKITHRLSAFGSSPDHRPKVTEFICELENGLMATLRLDKRGINNNVEYALGAQTARHVLAYQLSHALGVSICPATAFREILRHGLSAVSARISCTPLTVYKYMEDRITDTGQMVYDPVSLTEVIIFDYIIGSGHRPETSYVIDEQGIVRSTHHYEAFSYNADERVLKELAKSRLTVSAEFLRQLKIHYTKSFRPMVIAGKIKEEFGSDTWYLIQERLNEVIYTRRVAGIRFAIEEYITDSLIC